MTPLPNRARNIIFATLSMVSVRKTTGMRTSMCPIAMAPTIPLSCFNGRTSRIVMLDKNSLAPIEKIGAPLAAERRQTARSDLIVNRTDWAVDFNRFPNSFHDSPPFICSLSKTLAVRRATDMPWCFKSTALLR